MWHCGHIRDSILCIPKCCRLLSTTTRSREFSLVSCSLRKLSLSLCCEFSFSSKMLILWIHWWKSSPSFWYPTITIPQCSLSTHHYVILCWRRSDLITTSLCQQHTIFCLQLIACESCWQTPRKKHWWTSPGGDMQLSIGATTSIMHWIPKGIKIMSPSSMRCCRNSWQDMQLHISIHGAVLWWFSRTLARLKLSSIMWYAEWTWVSSYLHLIKPVTTACFRNALRFCLAFMKMSKESANLYINLTSHNARRNFDKVPTYPRAIGCKQSLLSGCIIDIIDVSKFIAHSEQSRSEKTRLWKRSIGRMCSLGRWHRSDKVNNIGQKI